MSNVGIFVAGVMVTLAVGAALALIVWGLIQDGRVQRAYEDEDALRRAGKGPTEASPHAPA